MKKFVDLDSACRWTVVANDVTSSVNRPRLTTVYLTAKAGFRGLADSRSCWLPNYELCGARPASDLKLSTLPIMSLSSKWALPSHFAGCYC